MYLCYFDESGDSGYNNSPTPAFTLSNMIVDDDNWLYVLDQIVSFRRYLFSQFGIPPRAELKANWLIHGRGPIANLGLSSNARLNVYLAAMRFQKNLGLTRSFAVVINKNLIYQQNTEARYWAWERAIERLERFGVSENNNLHILPDEGHGYFIKRLLRRMRRFHNVPMHYGTSNLDRRSLNIIEDSSDRKSEESYFIQFADLNAYAAYRTIYPHPDFGSKYWEELGDIRISEVNRISGGPTGIVSWP